MRKGIGLLFVVLLTVTSAALADPMVITPSTGILNLTRWEGTETGNLNLAAIASKVGYGGILEEWYKQDVGLPEAALPFAPSYTTTFSNDPSDPADADIEWVPGEPWITGSPIYLYVKDGNQDPAWYIFDLVAAGWDGKETLELRDFWPRQGAISHVEFVGATSVPEPLTLVLLGAGLIGLGLLRRR